MTTREQRLGRVRDLVARNQIESQEQLQDLLATEGIEVTQATLSRDLRALDVVKGPMGYVLPGEAVATDESVRGLRQRIQEDVLAVDPAGGLLVFSTRPGAERSLADAIRGARLHGVVGAMAGDAGLVLVVLRTRRDARRLRRQVTRLAQIMDAGD